MRPARTLPLLALAVAVLAPACAGTTTAGGAPAITSSPTRTTAPSTGTSSTVPGSTTPAAPVVELLDFEYPLLGGGTLRGADLAGKDVAFWFWAPW